MDDISPDFNKKQRLGEKATSPLNPQIVELVRFLNQGLDIYVRVDGAKNEQLVCEYILFTRPSVHQIMQNTDLVTAWRKLGFKEVIFETGYKDTWAYRL